MKTYLAVTAAVFGVLTAVHIWRMFAESHVATEPWFVLITAISALLCVWSVRLLIATRSSR